MTTSRPSTAAVRSRRGNGGRAGPARRWCAAGILLLANPARAEEGDLEFARAMACRGWYDLADEACRQIAASPRTHEHTRSAIPIVQAEIWSAQADTEPDLAKAQELIDRAVKLYDAFHRQSPKHPLAVDARVNGGWLRSRKAQFLLAAARVEADPAKQAALRKTALDGYAEVETFYRECIRDWRDVGPQSPANLQNALMISRLELARTGLDHARASGLQETERRQKLDEAIRLLVDFQFDYGDHASSFEALKLEGECHAERGDIQKAEQKIRAAMGLRQRLLEYNIIPNGEHLRVIRGASIALVKILARAGMTGEAIAAADRSFKDDPAFEKDVMGPWMKLEKADALFRSGQVANANALAKQIIDADPNSGVAFAVRDRQRSWIAIAVSGKIKVAPDLFVVAADLSMERRRWHDALQDLRACVDHCATSTDRDTYAPSAYYRMGQCFMEMRRYPEAAVAFEKVFLHHPQHELAPKACFEAICSLSLEIESTKGKQADALQDRFLKILSERWPNHIHAKDAPYFFGVKQENAKAYRKAADFYLQVGENAKTFDRAQVRAAHCLYTDAAAKWAKDSKPPSAQTDVRETLRKAEDILTRFFDRVAKLETTLKDADLLRLRNALIFSARQQLISICLHEAVGKFDIALKLIDETIKTISPQDERLARLWEHQIRALLGLNRLDDAVAILDRMCRRFPDGRAIAQASKSVAVKLDTVTTEMIENKGDPAAINENLKRIGTCYAKWLDEGPSAGLPVTIQDVVFVSKRLYLIAKRLNQFDDHVISYLDLKGRPLPEPRYWREAAFVHAMLAEGKVGNLPDDLRVPLLIRLARCYSFLGEWEKAKDDYTEIVKVTKLIDDKGALNATALRGSPDLLAAYLELGGVYRALALKQRQNRFQFGNALTVFNNVLGTEAATEPWWRAKHMALLTLFDRGTSDDANRVKVGLENLERNHPQFDCGKYGLKEKFIELKRKIQRVSPGGR
jgi:tetratricopeptide (TPR) repeat protein